MKSPEFSLPRHVSDFSWPGPAPLDLGPDLGDSELDDGLQQIGDNLLTVLYSLPDVDKLRVFLDAIQAPKIGRFRKNVYRELAQAANRPEKEVTALAAEDKAKLFCRFLTRLDRRSACTIIAGALGECYVPIARKLVGQLDLQPGQLLPLFQSVRKEVPDLLWEPVLVMLTREEEVTPMQRATIKTIRAEMASIHRPYLIPFAVNGPPELLLLEKHLLDLHAKDPALAKPLIGGLAQLNPARPENRFVCGLTGQADGQPQAVADRAWQLAGELYRWGDDLTTVDKPFNAERLLTEADAVRLIFNDPQFARARKLVGEYLIRQLVQVGLNSLAVELLSPEMARQHSQFLTPVILLEAQARVLNKQVEEVRALAARFPEIRAQGLLVSALRRSGQLEAAMTELRSVRASVDLSGERLLLEAKITDAFELAIPEERQEQEHLTQRLYPIYDATELGTDSNPENQYCAALHRLMQRDQDLAFDAYDDLLHLPDRYLSVRAYRFLAALLSRYPDNLEVELVSLETQDPDEVLAFLPTNLLKFGVRSLAFQEDPEKLHSITDFFYYHMPELLDSLLGHEELVVCNPALLQRWLDNNDKLSDPLQRWAGYQRVIQLATQAHLPDLVAQGIDGCLRIRDPLLAPYQAKLLEQQMTACEDLDLKEELAERMILLSPEQAKPCLYQLLHAYLGNNRRQDAWRMVEALKDINETSEDLEQCIRVLQPYFQPVSKSSSTLRKLPGPVSVGFYGGDETDKARTEQLRQELMRQYAGLTIEFEHKAWNAKHRHSLLDSVEKFDVVCASNLMRTDISRGLRQRAREQGKVFGFCRNRGSSTIADSILKAVEVHLATKR